MVAVAIVPAVSDDESEHFLGCEIRVIDKLA
jgi:hypothetical protein